MQKYRFLCIWPSSTMNIGIKHNSKRRQMQLSHPIMALFLSWIWRLHHENLPLEFGNIHIQEITIFHKWTQSCINWRNDKLTVLIWLKILSALFVISENRLFSDPDKFKHCRSPDPEYCMDPDRTLMCGGSYGDAIVHFFVQVLLKLSIKLEKDIVSIPVSMYVIWIQMPIWIFPTSKGLLLGPDLKNVSSQSVHNCE